MRIEWLAPTGKLPHKAEWPLTLDGGRGHSTCPKPRARHRAEAFPPTLARFLRTELPKAPKGMIAVKCSRCRTVQNVMMKQPTFECWQCKTVETVIQGRSS